MNKKVIKINNKLVYFFITLSSLLILLIIFETTNGNEISSYFFNNELDVIYYGRDTGMDFFHSIEYLKGSNPYGIYQTLYPPLANAFFLFIYNMIPDSVTQNWADDFTDSLWLVGSDYDLRTYQAPMFVFELFIILCVLGLLFATLIVLQGEKHAYLVGFCTVFSYGILYAFERGNIIILSVILSILFLTLYDDENPVKSEIGLLCLAFAAGLKIYPAIFGLFLITEKRYKEAIRAIIYGILSFVLPCFLFEGGISNLTAWIEILLDHNGSTNTSISFYLLSAIFFVAFLITKEKNYKILFLTYILIFIQSQGAYIYAYLIVPLLFMLKDHETKTKEEIIVLIMMVLTAPMPFYNSITCEICVYCLVSIQLLVIVYNYIQSMLAAKSRKDA